MLVPVAFGIALPFVLAVVCLLCRRSRPAALIALLGPASTLALAAGLALRIGTSRTATWTLAWFPELAWSASLAVDPAAIFFLALVGAVGLAIFVYARATLRERATPAFWALLLAFQGGMLGIVLADGLLLLFIFWEVTTVTSALLIGWHDERPAARTGAVQAFLVTGAGGLLLLVGAILLANLFGTTDLSALAARRDEVLAEPGHVLPLGLLLVAAAAKSAQVPFHFWLPGAMTAPAPVSAFLHSATMVKAGIVLVAKLAPAFGGSPVWAPLLGTIGALTFVGAGWNALRSDDLKRLLASTTSAFIGLILMVYAASPSPGAGLLLVASHATYKSALFLLAGWIEGCAGTKQLRELERRSGWARAPGTPVLLTAGALALAGCPLLLAFAAKEVALRLMLQAGPMLGAAFVAGSALAFATGLRLLWTLRRARAAHGAPAPSSRVLLAPALLLLPQLVGGLLPWLLPGASVPRPWPALWHVLDVELVLGLGAFALGGLLLALQLRLGPRAVGAGLAEVAQRGARALVGASSRLGTAVQRGGHPRFAAVVLLATAVAACLVALAPGAVSISVSTDEIAFAAIPALAASAGAIGVLVLRTRVAKLVALGGSGYAVALFYALFRAPDLVLTQVLVESLTLVLLLATFSRLPRPGTDRRSRRARLVHAGLAAGVGLGVALLGVAIPSTAPPDRAGMEQLRRAEPEAHGRNAVNVILVDFRAADTLGEITVLATAALGAVALLGGHRRGAEPA